MVEGENGNYNALPATVAENQILILNRKKQYLYIHVMSSFFAVSKEFACIFLRSYLSLLLLFHRKG